jgi:chitinase
VDVESEDIKSCQEKGKTIILSLGGATYNGGGFASAEAATTGAQEVWAMFGPNSDGGALRPFGDAVVDGFDYDFESPTQNMVPFGVELRRLMDAAGDKSYYLAAAPQCVFPDAANNEALDGGVSFDFIQIQFYNNWCGVVNFVEGSTQQTAYNFDVWDQWAASTSLNPNVKVLVGFPAREGAGGGYVTGSKLTGALQYSKTYSSFGGAMMWDMSQLYANDGFLAQVVSALG